MNAPGSRNRAGGVFVCFPFLADTCDRRKQEEVRQRSQTFEVLTGEDLVADDVEGADVGKSSEGEEASLRFVPPMPEIVDELRATPPSVAGPLD